MFLGEVKNGKKMEFVSKNKKKKENKKSGSRSRKLVIEGRCQVKSDVKFLTSNLLTPV